MTGNQYLTGLTLYFVGYVLFELPCNIILKRTTPKFWLPTLTLVWGEFEWAKLSVNYADSFVHDRYRRDAHGSDAKSNWLLHCSLLVRKLKEGWSHELTMRSLGVSESGLFPGVVYYLSMWYKRDERQYRISLFFSCASLAGAFGGILVSPSMSQGWRV
jgi:MFS family permease